MTVRNGDAVAIAAAVAVGGGHVTMRVPLNVGVVVKTRLLIRPTLEQVRARICARVGHCETRSVPVDMQAVRQRNSHFGSLCSAAVRRVC